jgi:hypothetical protein
MKKRVLLIATVFAASTTFAQDLTSRKGETILPEANDWAISFDAAPFLDYAGGFLGGNSSSPSGNYISGMPWHIRGKMFKDDKTAYRAGLRLAFGSMTQTSMIGDATATVAPTFPALPTLKEDQYKAGATDIVLSAGLEMRRGTTRLQGYYGGEFFFSMSSTKDSYTYGNTLAASGTVVTVNGGTTTNFGANIGTDTYGNAARITEEKSSTIGFGLRGFIGAEYFIMPKISIGLEYGWGLGLSSNKSSATWESVDLGVPATGTQTMESGKNGSFGFDTDINYGSAGSLNIIFHF